MTQLNKIFVQIASYRDVQLLPTIRDCIAMAKHPENLTFGVCWQHDETESMEEFADDPRFKIVDVPHKDSQGCCWARSKTQELYAGETYTMQIDSHMRFVHHWDELCVKMMNQLLEKGHKKPMLTGYPPSFFPDNDPAGRMQYPLQMAFDKFVDYGVINFKCYKLLGYETMTAPAPCMFVSAGFIFTLGQFCKEVPYDPNIQFRGEEITLCVRAYTHGYDFFHPHEIVLWHEYTRPTAPKNNLVTEATKQSYQRCEVMLGVGGKDMNSIDFGIYGFGNERTLEDYENFSGICFKTKDITKYLEMTKAKN
jgi:Glycosyltransferase (GlcNAc)